MIYPGLFNIFLNDDFEFFGPFGKTLNRNNLEKSSYNDGFINKK